MNLTPHWCREVDGQTIYRVTAWLVPEASGGFSLEAIKMRGVVTQGETVLEAMENLKDAAKQTILFYQSVGLPLPFITSGDVEKPKDAVRVTVFVPIEN